MEFQKASVVIATTQCPGPMKKHQLKQRKQISPKLTAKRRELRDAIKKFQRACQQLRLLNRKCLDMKTRLERADRDQMSCFRHNLIRKMTVIQSTREMYNEYVYMKSEDITALRFEIKHWVEDTEESDDEE